ncbi:MAG: DUF6089 family protein [Flavobacteriales bacterium]
MRYGGMRMLSLFACLFISVGLFAQAGKYDRSKEIGLHAGTAYYLGEINPYRHFGGKLRFSGGLSFRNNFDRRWTLRLGFLYGQVEAWDKDSDDPWRRNRNLNFRNQFYEGSALVELNFVDYQIGSEDWITPYLFTGLSYYSMNPQGNVNDSWKPLQPAGTEGQGLPDNDPVYRTTGLAIPAGVGLRMNLFAIFGLSLEWGIRRTWTDYFDDVSGVYPDPNLLINERSRLTARLSDQSLLPELSDGTNKGLQRGDPGRKDLYFFVTGALTIRIDKKANSCWK